MGYITSLILISTGLAAAAATCKTGSWSPWTPCSVTCFTEGGKRSRFRYTGTKVDSDHCLPGTAIQFTKCKVHKFCKEGSVILRQQGLKECDKSSMEYKNLCLNGGICWVQQSLGQYECLCQPGFGGDKCLEKDVFASDRDKKTVQCKYGEWSQWSACSATCGYGKHSRARNTSDRYIPMACTEGVEKQFRDCGSLERCPVGAPRGVADCSHTYFGSIKTDKSKPCKPFREFEKCVKRLPDGTSKWEKVVKARSHFQMMETYCGRRNP